MKHFWISLFQKKKGLFSLGLLFKVQYNITSIFNQMNSKLLQFAEIALVNGCIEGIGQGRYIPLPLAVNTFESPPEFHSLLSHLQIIWQKYLSKIQKDQEIIDQIFQLGSDDPYIAFLRSIDNKTRHNKSKVSKQFLTFFRCDYLLDEKLTLKLVEYNTMQMGMFYYSDQITSSYIKWSKQPKNNYFENKTTKFLADTVLEHYKVQNLKGCCLIVISSCQILTIGQQKQFQFFLNEEGIQTRRIKYDEILTQSKVDEQGNLFINGELISIAYFRSGFLMKEYDEVGLQGALQARSILAGSNITCIPSIRMEVLNTKLAQSFISKPAVLRKFLSQSEAQQLQDTIIQDYYIRNMTKEDLQKAILKVREDPNGWILKPNMDGGQNNIFGSEVLLILQNLQSMEYRDYVLVKYIKNPPFYENGVILRGFKYIPYKCTYEISRYGAISEVNGNVIRNSASGYLLRTKQYGKFESDFYWGCDSYAVWKKSNSPLSYNAIESGRAQNTNKNDNPSTESEYQNEFIQSKICVKKQEVQFLMKILDQPDSIDLLFRGSEYGFSAQAFHAKCDNIADTLVLVKTQFGKKIGGFTHYKWNDEKKDKYGWVNDQQMRSFIFSLTLKQKMLPNDQEYLIRCNPKYGPCFGSGLSDLYISDNCNMTSSSYSNFPLHYNLESGNRYINSQKSWQSFSGCTQGYNFKVIEYEVFKVKFK